MAGFKDLHNEDFVILASKGTYKQCSLATLPGGGLYAKLGSGYIRLYKGRETSNSNQRIVSLEIVSDLYSDPYGRLAVNRGEARVALTDAEKQVLKLAKE